MDNAAAENYLTQAVLPLRLAVTDANGCPVVASHWFEYRDGAIYCVLHKNSLIARRLQRDGRCGFEVASEAPPYHGARGQGEAELLSDGAESQLRRLFARYDIREDSELARWLLGRAADERLVKIVPSRLSSWDYRDRMKDALAAR